MAGHSKFANIKHRKGAQDKKRGKLFSRLAREVTVAARSGLPDPDANPRLRAAIQAANAANMPKDNVQRAIDKATGGGDADALEEIRYEGYGPGGVAVIVETVTDNRNRTASEVRAAFTKYGGNLGETGSVGFMFDRVGMIVYPAKVAAEDKVFEAALEAGAENVESDQDEHVITCPPDDLAGVSEVLTAKFGDPESAKLDWKPKTLSDVDEKTAVSLFKLLDALDDLDDVQSISSNEDVAEDILAKMAG